MEAAADKQPQRIGVIEISADLMAGQARADKAIAGFAAPADKLDVLAAERRLGGLRGRGRS